MLGLPIGQRKQCQFFASVKRGDDPRRPTAKPSAAGIEQNRSPEVRGARYARAHVLRPIRGKTMPWPSLCLKRDELLRHDIYSTGLAVLGLTAQPAAHQELASVGRPSCTCLSPAPSNQN